jgi:hypothetical protein
VNDTAIEWKKGLLLGGSVRERVSPFQIQNCLFLHVEVGPVALVPEFDWSELTSTEHVGVVLHPSAPSGTLFFIYFVSDILPPVPYPETAQPPLDPDQEFIRNFWSPPTNLYPYFLFPSSTHGTAHGTFRTHSNTGTITGMGTATGTATNSTAFGSHSSVEETLVTSLQFPELVVPGESAFSTVLLYSIVSLVVSFALLA